MAEPTQAGRADDSRLPPPLRAEREGLQREVHAPPAKNRIGPLLGVLVLIIAAGAGGFYFWQRAKIDTPLVDATPAPGNAATKDPEPKHYPPPVPSPAEIAEAKPLPTLDESDPAMRDVLVDLVGSEAMQKLLSTQDVVRHIVVTVDNLPRKTVAVRLNPVKPAAGEFRTSGNEQQRTIAPENAARYAPYVQIAAQVDAKKLVSAYGRLYPLFQKAYEDLGYPKSFFNDRLIAVIDHLLGAPEVNGPVAVVAPHVQYRFADPELEAQSAGRKFLIRIGPENAAVIKSKLREVRRELTRTGTAAK